MEICLHSSYYVAVKMKRKTEQYTIT